jgi:arginyl-tRNA--protein-N-Asp/Glu arginylyltransferase
MVVALEDAPAGTLSRLSRAGFRRSHGYAYRPSCPDCSACVSIRIPVARFAPDRTQRRILRRNFDLTGVEVAAIATREHYALFKPYVTHRHSDGDMAQMSFADFRAMLENALDETCLIEHRGPDGRLVAAVLADRLADGPSAVYSFFDPAQIQRSLGTYVVLDLVARARADGLPHVYLGYWIEESRKMTYKSRFRPTEILSQGLWRTLAIGADTAQEIQER